MSTRLLPPSLTERALYAPSRLMCHEDKKVTLNKRCQNWNIRDAYDHERGCMSAPEFSSPFACDSAASVFEPRAPFPDGNTTRTPRSLPCASSSRNGSAFVVQKAIRDGARPCTYVSKANRKP